jgi:diadenosine tetraphosphate (Ap4A) HIT family hydrolase
MSRDCCFCEELRTGWSADLSARYGDAAVDRAVWQSADFAAVPSLGQLAYGHMLVLPRAHTNSFAQAADPDRRRDALASVVDVLEATFGPCVSFEHGTDDGATTGGCGIVHAHVHLVPVYGASPRALPVAPGLRWRASDRDHWHESGLGRHGRGYLFVQLPSCRAFIGDAQGVPSQFLRRWAAEWLQNDQWDWRTAGREDQVLRLADWMRATTTPRGFAVRARA